MRSDDRFATVTVIAVLVATGAVFVAMNAGVSTGPVYEVRYEAVPTVVPIERPRPGTWDEADASPAVLREGATVPVPAVEEPVELPALLAASEGVLLARAPVPGLPSVNAVLVRADGDGRLVVAAGTSRRYRPLVSELEGFRAADLARASAGNRAATLLAAVDRLLAVEVPEFEPEMVRRGIRWGFADPSHEALDEAQRHLLLMGRSQHRRVRAKLLELRAGLGAYPEAPFPAFVTASMDAPDATAPSGAVPPKTPIPSREAAAAVLP